MKFSTEDLSRIKWPLLALLVTLAAGAAAIWFSDDFLAAMRRGHVTAERQLLEARNKLQHVQKEREDIETYFGKYRDLIVQGVVGDDRRLDWIEAVEKIRERKQLFSVKYVMSPQKNYIPGPALPTGNFDFNVSNMALQFSLLHEEQLFTFLDDLRAQVKGMPLLEHCSIERASELQELKYAPQLKAECSLNWLTLKDRSAK